MICLGVILLAAFVAAAPVEEFRQQKSTEVCFGLDDGYYQLQDCSRRYWECKKGVSYVYMCRRGYYFDREIRQCKKKSTSKKCRSYNPKPLVVSPGPQKKSSCKHNCKYAKPKNFSNFCSKAKDGYYTEYRCDNNFIKCEHKKLSLYRCPENYFFDHHRKTCVKREYVFFCSDAFGKPQDFGLVASLSPFSLLASFFLAPPEKIDEYCKDKVGLYSDVKCGRQFIECFANKTGLVKSCPLDQIFDDEKRTCVYKESVQYCIDGSNKPQDIGFIPAIGVVASLLSSASSINNLFFDTASSVAEYCMDKPAGLYNELQCDRVYIECYSNQTGVGKACPLGQILDHEKRICVKTEDVEYCKDAFTKPQDFGIIAGLGVAASLLSGASSVKNLFFSDPAELNKYCKDKVGLYSDVQCEREYIECFANKTGLTKSCPMDYIFDDRRQICAKREDVKQCEDAFNKPQNIAFVPALGVAASLLSGASSIKNLFFSDPAKLNKYCIDKVGLYSDVKCERDYIECFANKTGLVKSCPMDKIFDDEKRVCVYKESVQYCNAVGKPQDIAFIPALGVAASLLSAASSINNLFFMSTPNVAEFCLNRDVGRYSEVKCDKEYIECYADKTGEVKTCPFDQIFDDQKGLCVAISAVPECKVSVAMPVQDINCDGMLCSTPAVNSTVACLELSEGYHEVDNCSQFFLSCNGLASKMEQCPDLLIFDPVMKKCGDFAEVKSCRGY